MGKWCEIDIGIQSGFINAGSFQRFVIYSAWRIPILKISNTCMYTFHIVANIKHYTGEYVEYKRETYRQK
jgi:hypothetical protein